MNPTAYLFEDNGNIPNNRTLPLLIYQDVFQGEGETLARTFEKQFTANGWPAAWRYGIYPFAHYHSTAHEVLGIFQGTAVLRLGHETGVKVEVKAGDAVVIPAGVGHECFSHSDGFEVVGAYPQGQEADLIRTDRSARPAADKAIVSVPLPQTNPVDGTPMAALWPS